MARLVILSFACGSFLMFHVGRVWIGILGQPHHTPRLDKRFARMRANGDGTVSVPEFDENFAEPPSSPVKITKKRGSRSKLVLTRGGKISQEGLFSPLVDAAKSVLGEEEFNRFRGEAIKAHTAAITSFIDSLRCTDGEQPTRFGAAAISYMFKLADVDGSGQLDKEELRKAVEKAGFTWLAADHKVDQLMERVDTDDNALIDFEEFAHMAPTVLRQNLFKLAKKNGNYLGFLV